MSRWCPMWTSCTKVHGIVFPKSTNAKINLVDVESNEAEAGEEEGIESQLSKFDCSDPPRASWPATEHNHRRQLLVKAVKHTLSREKQRPPSAKALDLSADLPEALVELARS